MPITILPTQPGEAMLEVWTDNDGTNTEWMRVIAWRVETTEDDEVCLVRAIRLDGTTTLLGSAEDFTCCSAYTSSLWFFAPHRQLHNAVRACYVKDEAEAVRKNEQWRAQHKSRAAAAMAEGGAK